MKVERRLKKRTFYHREGDQNEKVAKLLAAKAQVQVSTEFQVQVQFCFGKSTV